MAPKLDRGGARRPGAARLALRGAIRGGAFGLLAATVESFLLTVGKMRLGLAVPRGAMVEAVLLEGALGLCLGLLAAPLLRARRGAAVHLLAVTAAWLLLGVLAGLPELPLHLALTVVPWGVAALGVGLGTWTRTRRRLRWLPAAAVAILLVGTLAAPEVPALAASPPAPRKSEAPPSDAPDVVLVVLDTVRADHVGAYGYDRPTTPHLDALARQGAVYLDATAPATWSLPSHASLFTGQLPSGHGAHAEHRVLGPELPTLAERLSDAGYATRCFTSNPWINDDLGLTRGFDHADRSWRSGAMGRTRLFAFRLLDRLGAGPTDKGGTAVVERFERWASQSPAETPPTFAFVNLIEAHFPYHQVPAEQLARFTDRDRAELREVSLALFEAQFGGEPPDPERAAEPATAMYDAGIAHADALLGRMVDALRARGTLDDTVLVILSDHGELLGDRGAWGHGHSLYEQEIRVPLVVRHPGRVPAASRTSTPVSTVGVFATVMDLLELEPPPTLHVGSLLPALEGGPAGGPVIAERLAGQTATALASAVERRGLLRAGEARMRAFRSGDDKLVVGSDGSVHLFDLAADPTERRDLAEARPEPARALRSQLRAAGSALGLPAIGEPVERERSSPSELDDDVRERLRALGYVQ